MTAKAKLLPRSDPLSGSIPGTKIVLKESVSVFHLSDPDLDKSMWQTYSEGFVMLLDIGILGIHTFGIWIPLRQKWLAKVAVQSTQIYPAPDDIKGFIWALGRYEEQLFFAFRFRTALSAKRFVTLFQKCEKGTLLRHSFSDLSVQESDIGGLTPNTYVNPHQSPLTRHQSRLATSSNSRVNSRRLLRFQTTKPSSTAIFKRRSSKVAPMKPSGWDADTEEQVAEKEVAEKEVAKKESAPICHVHSTESNVSGIQEVRNNNFAVALVTRRGPKVIVLVTDRAKTEAKTYLVCGRVGNLNDAMRIVNRLKSEGCIQGEVKIRNFRFKNRFNFLLSKLMDFIMEITNSTPRLEVLHLEVHSFDATGNILENQTGIEKAGRSILYLGPRSGRVTRDYPACLDMECMYRKLEPAKRSAIDPDKVIESLKSETTTAVVSPSTSAEHTSVSAGSSTSMTSMAVSSSCRSSSSQTSSTSTGVTVIAASRKQTKTPGPSDESSPNMPKKKFTKKFTPKNVDDLPSTSDSDVGV